MHQIVERAGSRPLRRRKMSSPRSVTIDPVEYEDKMKEVQTLPQRKQKQWKSHLLDKYGTKSRLIYRDGKLWNYSLFESQYVEVLPFDRTAKHMVPTSHLGHATIAGGGDMAAEIHAEVTANHTGKHYRNHFVKIGKQSDGCVRG